MTAVAQLCDRHAQLCDGRTIAQYVTAVVAQWAKGPGMHATVAASISSDTPRYCNYKIKNALRSTRKV